MTAIDGWVDGMTAALSEKIAAEINDKMLSLKRSFAGKRGRNAQTFALAQSYLLNNLSDDMTEEAQDDVIAAAIAQYSKPIVDAVIEKLWPKKAMKPAAAAEDPAAAGWC